MSTTTPLLYLADHTEWLAHHRDAEAAFDELEHICALVDTMIDSRPASIYAGPCDVCRRDMYAKQDADVAECKLCNITFPMAERREKLLESVADQLETAANISAAVTDLGEPVTPEVIRKWAERGRLIPKGKDHRGRPMYRVGDVLDLRRTLKRRSA
jgi:hypothetical protein